MCYTKEIEMKKIEFDIKYRKEIESGHYLVRTNHSQGGKPARIICWDKKGEFPIVALVIEGDGSADAFEVPYSFNKNGISQGETFGLVLIDPMPNLNPLERAYAEAVYGDKEYLDDEDVKEVKTTCEKLYNITGKMVKDESLRGYKMYTYKEDCDLANNAIGMLTNGACFLNNRSRDEVVSWLRELAKRMFFLEREEEKY